MLRMQVVWALGIQARGWSGSSGHLLACSFLSFGLRWAPHRALMSAGLHVDACKQACGCMQAG